MPSGGTSPRVIWATLGLLVLAGVVSYFGVQSGNRLDEELPAPTTTERSTTGPVFAVQLPYTDPSIPPGPHRDLFVTSCSTCHSPRLIFTQPRLNEAQWTASVKKMITVYGAPIKPDNEKDLVTYLTSLPGQQEMR